LGVFGRVVGWGCGGGGGGGWFKGRKIGKNWKGIKGNVQSRYANIPAHPSRLENGSV